MTRVNLENVPDERLWFTEKRSNYLKKLDPEISDRILHLEKKFGKICFLPLDIPIIKPGDQDKFVDWYFRTCKPSIKQNKDIATQYTGSSALQTIDLLPDWCDAEKSVWSKNIVQDFPDLWPDLWEQFYEYLPFKNIIGFSIWSSTKDIIPHRDQSLFLDLPLEFRIMLHDTNPEPNLFVSESLPNISTDQIGNQVSVPNHLSTNSFVWSNLRSRHFSYYNEKFKKILMIFHFINEIDWDKYEKLIEKSFATYQNLSLISNNNLNNFVYNES